MDEWGIEVEEEIPVLKQKALKGRSMWDVMNSSINKKVKPTLQEKQKISEFLFQRLLARFENTLDFSLMFTTKNIPIEHQYDIIDTLVPKGFVPFEKNKKAFSSETLDNVVRHYRCSDVVAEQYLEIMPESEIERINKKYKKGKI